ncbi:hypothetical protein BKA69DRAFT_1061733 [Paraphysoderma sedebokerense]|nr:hypothetical protein BKA69DRAFT_1061733 [Paraphysoderma sedebokerense]
MYNADIIWYSWWAQWTFNPLIRQLSFFNTILPLNLPRTAIPDLLGIFVGTPQFVILTPLLAKIYENTNWKNPKRVAITLSTTGAWVTDTLGYFTHILPKPASDIATMAVDGIMYGFYIARYHYLLSSGYVGMVPSKTEI